MQTQKDSELRYRRLFEAAQDGILILDAETGMIEDVNPFLINMLGYSREEFIKKKLWEVGAFKDIEASQDAFEALQENEYIRYEDLPLKAKDGRLIQVEFVSTVYLAGGEKVIQCNIRDITEHKRIIAALQENEKKYYDLINQSPDGFFIIELSGNILTVNKAMCKELEFDEEEFLSMNIWDIIPEQYLDQYRERLTKILKGESLREAAEYVVRGKDGKNHYVEVLSAPRYSGKDIIGFQGIARDVTARKRAEEALRESEERYRQLLEFSPDAIVVHSGGNFVFVNPAAVSIYGATNSQELLGKPMLDRVHPDYRNVVKERLQRLHEGMEAALMEEKFLRLDGSVIEVEAAAIPFTYQGKTAVLVVIRDITERKRADEALRNSEIKLRSLFAAMQDVIIVYDADGRYLEIAPTDPTNLYRPLDDMLGKTVTELFPPDQASFFLDHIRQTLKTGQLTNGEYSLSFGDQVRWFSASVSPLSSNSVIWVAHDITHRKAAEERIRRQFEHLTALSAIDQFIAANFDLKLSLSEILTHVTGELGIDAADILILKSNSQMLEYGAERGFRTKAIRNAQVRLGESYAGRAALERHLVQIPNLRDEPHNLFLTTLLTGEGFVCYYGVPLIAKGQVKGVLEVFHRAPLEPDAEWFDFLNALAGRAAIAIDNLTLFDDLQRSNSELMLAYETTLAGWSHALDLRDKETEGHTQRVTETTVKLARAFGLSEAELVNVRRGGLLHDIGKMGVPDNILLKPSELTKEEWNRMRMHPVYAYDMLSHIAYLHAALDIPYCHHEKWDGTGYPRGLKGEEIPLSARIFAVVDVWDAINSDRPYRPAWTKEKAREHIRSLSGTHFDPHVVDIFMQFPI